MFQPTHPKARAQKELRTVELQLLDWHAQLEMAGCNVNMLEERKSRLLRYVKNYDVADTNHATDARLAAAQSTHNQIPQAF